MLMLWPAARPCGVVVVMVTTLPDSVAPVGVIARVDADGPAIAADEPVAMMPEPVCPTSPRPRLIVMALPTTLAPSVAVVPPGSLYATVMALPAAPGSLAAHTRVLFVPSGSTVAPARRPTLATWVPGWMPGPVITLPTFTERASMLRLSTVVFEWVSPVNDVVVNPVALVESRVRPLVPPESVETVAWAPALVGATSAINRPSGSARRRSLRMGVVTSGVEKRRGLDGKPLEP